MDSQRMQWLVGLPCRILLKPELLANPEFFDRNLLNDNDRIWTLPA